MTDEIPQRDPDEYDNTRPRQTLRRGRLEYIGSASGLCVGAVLLLSSVGGVYETIGAVLLATNAAFLVVFEYLIRTARAVGDD